MDILVGDLENKILEIFDSSKVLSVDKQSGSTDKFIISINRILYNDINVIYTKFVFHVDDTKLKNNYFSYLYDINCEYIRIDFSDLNDFGNKISNIFKENKFGKDIKILSDFIKSPSTLINKWFQENKITNISVVNLDFTKIEIIPCEDISFDFKIELNNNQKVDLTIKKESDNKYLFNFKFLDNIYEEEQKNLNRLIETIGNNLKNKIKM